MKPSVAFHPVRSGFPAICVLATAIVSLLALPSAQAAAFTWANSNVTGTPGTPRNWIGATQGTWTGGTPASNNANTIQFFQDTTTALTNTGASGNTQTSNIDNGGTAFQLGVLTLSGKASATAGANLAMTISGDPLNFPAATGTVNLDGVNNSTQTLTYNLNSNIQLGTSAGTGALTLTGTGTGTFNIGANISELQTGGGRLIKSGTSTVTLSGTNSYTGGTVINSGTLKFNSSGAIAGNGRTVTVGSGAVATAGYAINNNFLNRLVENSSAPVIALGANSSNNLDLSSSTGATLPNAYLGATGTFTYSGTLTPGSNGFFLGGGGYGGSGGGNTSVTVSSVLGGTTKGLTLGGNVILNGSAVNTFTGGVNLTNGGMVGGVSATLFNPNSLTLDFTNRTTPTNLVDPANVLTLGGGRLHLAGKNSTTSSQTFASTTLSANTTSIVSMAVGTGTASVGVTLGTITRNPGSSLFYAIQNGTPPNGTTLLAPTATANDASGILGTWAFGSNAAYAANNGSGQVIAYLVPGANAFTTAAGLSGMNDVNQNFQMTGTNGLTYTLTGNITGNTLALTQTSQSTWSIANASNSITLNGILAVGSSASSSRTISGTGNLVIGANKELVINVFRPLTISCPIVDNPAGQSALTYTSNCTSDSGYALTFNGTAANTYSGTTTVAGGSLALNKTAGVNAIAGDVVVSSGALIWSANNQIKDPSKLTLFNTGKVSGTPTETVASVTTTGNTGGFAFGSNTNFTVSGALSLTGNQGPADVTASSYGLSGTAKMTVGSLSLDNAYYSVGTAAADTATLTLNGDLTGANTSSLNTTATAPKFVLNGSGTHTHTFSITSGTTTISPPISETASTTAALTKTGAGTLVLAGTDSCSGATTVSGGSLLVNNTLSGTGAVTVQDTATLGGSSSIAGAVTVNAGGTLRLGASGATLTLANSTAPSYASTSKLKVFASASTLDKISASATSSNSVANVDLVIDTTSLSGNVASTTIYSAGGAITGPFSSVSVIGNTSYTATVDYSTSGQIKLALDSSGPLTPTITPSGTLVAVNTTYGTASATPTSFTVSGANMSAGITVTPPAGFEVSQTVGGASGYAGSATAITVGAAGTIASTTIYVRLAATATIGAYSGNITCTSSGATSQNVATVSSAVSKANSSVTAPTVGTYTYTGVPQGPNSGAVASGSSGALTYSYTNSGGTSYGPSATQPTNAGNYTVTATVAADTNYNSASSSATAFTLSPAALTITANNQNKPYGSTQSTPVTGSTAFTPTGLKTNETVGTVTLTYGDGGLSATDAVGSTSTITPSAASGGTFSAANYSIGYSAGTLTVTKPMPTITTPPTATAISYGQTLASSTLTGGAASVDGTFAFTTPSTTPGLGAASQSVTFSPTDSTHYSTATTTVTVTVNKATPTITTAPTATAITYGQTLNNSTLSGTFLNAAGATVPGTLAFTSPSTMPNAGTNNESVTFTPNDTTNYSNGSTSVNVVVNKATPSVTVTGTTRFTYSGSPQGPASATTGGSTGTVTYNYAGSGGMSYSGTTPPTNAGSYTVTATVAADSNHNSASSSAAAFSIDKVSQTIDFTLASSVAISAGTLALEGTATSGLTVNYASSNSTIASVSGATLTLHQGGSVTLSASQAGNDNYTAAAAVDRTLVITGFTAVNDAVSRPANDTGIKIPIATLLANDGQVGGDGSVTPGTNLTITGVTAGTGNSVSIAGDFVFFTPSDPAASDPTTFTYTVKDSSDITATATVTVSTVDATPFTLDLLRVVSAPVFANGETSVTVEFAGVQGQTYQIEYSTDLETNHWSPPVAVTAETAGIFNATFSAPGDQRAAWSKMFFRASR